MIIGCSGETYKTDLETTMMIFLNVFTFCVIIFYFTWTVEQNKDTFMI